jgi:hypothetical protein
MPNKGEVMRNNMSLQIVGVEATPMQIMKEIKF